MAATNFHHQHHDQTPKFLYLGGGGDQRSINPLGAVDGSFEMSESDVWNVGDDYNSNEPRRSKFPLLKPHQQRKPPMSEKKSMAVNVPDWSMILRDEYKIHGKRNSYDDGDDDDDDEMLLPPHEYLARTRIASFSVHEGVGRTLKGRDMSRVRNAIWKQTGFEQD